MAGELFAFPGRRVVKKYAKEPVAVNENVPIEFSDWQTDRMRCRLRAYLMQLQRAHWKRLGKTKFQSNEQTEKVVDSRDTEPSWSTVARQICTNPRSQIWAYREGDGIVEEGEDSDGPISDSEGPIDENVLRKFVQGERKQGEWRFSRPASFKLMAFHEFLKEKRFISQEDLMAHDASIPVAEAMYEYLNGNAPSMPTPPLFNGDYHCVNRSGSRKVHERILTIHLDRTGKFYRIRETRWIYDKGKRNSEFDFEQRVQLGDFDFQLKLDGWAPLSFNHAFHIYAKPARKQSRNFFGYVLATAYVNSGHAQKILFFASDNPLVTESSLDSTNASRAVDDASITNQEILEFTVSYSKSLTKKAAYAAMVRGSNEYGPLMKIHQKGHEEDLLKELLEEASKSRQGKEGPHSRADVVKEKMQKSELSKLLFKAASEGLSEEMSQLIAQGADVNYRDPLENEAIIHIVAAGSAQRALNVLTDVPELNYLVRDNLGRFPSAIAQEVAGNPEMSQILMEREIVQAEERGLDYRALIVSEQEP